MAFCMEKAGHWRYVQDRYIFCSHAFHVFLVPKPFLPPHTTETTRPDNHRLRWLNYEAKYIFLPLICVCQAFTSQVGGHTASILHNNITPMLNCYMLYHNNTTLVLTSCMLVMLVLLPATLYLMRKYEECLRKTS